MLLDEECPVRDRYGLNAVLSKKVSVYLLRSTIRATADTLTKNGRIFPFMSIIEKIEYVYVLPKHTSSLLYFGSSVEQRAEVWIKCGTKSRGGFYCRYCNEH